MFFIVTLGPQTQETFFCLFRIFFSFDPKGTVSLGDGIAAAERATTQSNPAAASTVSKN